MATLKRKWGWNNNPMLEEGKEIPINHPMHKDFEYFAVVEDESEMQQPGRSETEEDCK